MLLLPGAEKLAKAPIKVAPNRADFAHTVLSRESVAFYCRANTGST